MYAKNKKIEVDNFSIVKDSSMEAIFIQNLRKKK